MGAIVSLSALSLLLLLLSLLLASLLLALLLLMWLSSMSAAVSVVGFGSLLLSSPSEGAGRSGRAASKLARSARSLSRLQWRCRLHFDFALTMVGVKPGALGGLVRSADRLRIGVWGAEVAIAVRYSTRVNEGRLQEVDDGRQRD
ncbi:hypothetical protein BDW60DRAFT_157437 [Aspergillus nidulans var. acristatus]